MQHFEPRAYQKLAAKFIYDHPRCNLWAVPGMGKTSIIYSVVDLLKLVGSAYFPVLVIAPLKVCELTWPAEHLKWDAFAGLNIVQITGHENLRSTALLTLGDVYVINYENLPWLVKQFAGRTWPFRIVVADESTRLKNYRERGGGKRSKALSEIAHIAGRWINMTGTPAPNGYRDLWGQQWYVDFGHRLGSSYTAYMRRWFYENPYTRVVELRHPDCQKEIDSILADCTMSLRAEDWMQVAEPNTIPREVLLPPTARAIYDKLERDFWIEIAQLEARREVTAVNAAALSSKLLQLASGAVYDDTKTPTYVHDAKVEALRSIVEELNEPLLVSHWFRFEIPMLQKAFPEMRVFRTKQDEDDWNSGKIPLMAIHPASAGHGVNLQYGGRAMAHFSHTWDLEMKMQVQERIGPVRQKSAGFSRAVLHYPIIARNTLDEDVIARTDRKMSIQDALMAAHARRQS